MAKETILVVDDEEDILETEEEDETAFIDDATKRDLQEQFYKE